jgi:hypothetical protein
MRGVVDAPDHGKHAPGHGEDAVDDGSLHVERSARLPGFLQFREDPLLKGWSVVGNVRSTFEGETTKAGWVSFFMAGRIQKAAFGFNRRKTLGAALTRLAKRVKSGNCNSFEIMHVTTKHFLGVFRVSVAAHARHFQKGSVYFER